MHNDHQKNKELPKVVVLLGPTACGKTGWGLKLAEKFAGEIISADSRQVYKKMDVGTAKARGGWRWNGLRRTYFVEGIPHHLMDFLDPSKVFTVAEFRDKAIKYIKITLENGRLPIIVGGTALYIQALVDNWQIPRVVANKKLRESLENKSNEELVNWLNRFDPDTVLVIDQKNKRRLIRALEVCIISGQPFSKQRLVGEPLFNFLQIGIDVPKEVLHEKIDKRLDKMMAEGLVKEAESLVKQKYDWNLPSMSGIGYREFKDYFAGKISLEEALKKLKQDNHNYAKRQMTWFKRDKRVKWCGEYEEAESLVNDFVNSK